VWQDDSFEVFCSTVPMNSAVPPKKCLHLGVSASGARYDALWTYVTPTLPTCNIPRVDVLVDGKSDDWADQGLRIASLTGRFRNELGKMRAKKDFDPSFRIGWNDEGLVLLAEVQDNVVHEWENDSQLWIGDCIDIFLSPKVGSREHYRCIATPGAGPDFKGRCVLTDRRKEKGGELAARVAGQKTPQGYLLEVLLPWANLNVEPAEGAEIAMQLMAADDDVKGGGYRFRSAWHPAGEPTSNPRAYVTLRLAREPSPAIEFKRSAKTDRYRLYTAVPPYTFPATLPSLGGEPEDPKYAAEWSSAVQPSKDGLTVELAIPWRTLSTAGLDRNRLMLNLRSRGPLAHAPSTGRGFVALVVVPPNKAQPRNLSLRLHFAEIDGAKPGHRVFDVKVQGREVLKDFDVVKAAGGPNRAIAKTFPDLTAVRALTIELVPKAEAVSAATAPILSAIELLPPRAGD